MAAVKVYQFTKYDISTDKTLINPRMATRQFIEMARGTIIEGTEREIDSGLIDEDGQAPVWVQPIH